MKLLLIPFLLLEIPFEIPESLIYRPPESLFTQRKEITQLKEPKTYHLFLSNTTLEIKFPWGNIKRTLLPAKGPDGKLVKTVMDFSLEKGYFNLIAGVKELEYGKFISIEDSLEASLISEYFFFSYKVKNWTDYFPLLREAKFKFYATSYATLGFKIKDAIVPYLLISRVDRKQKVCFGITWLMPHGYIGMQVKENTLNALFLNFALKDASVELKLDRSDYYYGLWAHSEYVPFDSLLLSRKLSKFTAFKTALTLNPFYFSYERRQFSHASVQNPSTLLPLEAGDFTENIYNFGFGSDNFNLFYTHFQSPYSVIKDTLTAVLYLREKYYDLALCFNIRNHQEVFNMLNLEVLFKIFKNFNPYLKVVNLFDVQGNYLPSIKAKRRYVEVGCQFQREI
ncbi:MAG: hypothetical protein QMD82_02275 [bacterium]|nr:hypothetical protein [bacterium]